MTNSNSNKIKVITTKAFRGRNSHLRISKIDADTDCQVDLEKKELGINYSKYFFSDKEYENLKYKHLDNKLYRMFMKRFFIKVKNELINNESQYILPYSLGFIECGKMYKGACFRHKLKGFRSLKKQMGYIRKFRFVFDKNFIIYYMPYFNTTGLFKTKFKFDHRTYFSSYEFKSSHETRFEFLQSLKYKDTRTLKTIKEIETVNNLKLGGILYKQKRKIEDDLLLGRRGARAIWMKRFFRNYDNNR